MSGVKIVFSAMDCQASLPWPFVLLSSQRDLPQSAQSAAPINKAWSMRNSASVNLVILPFDVLAQTVGIQ
jgi:hypothetical protein